MVCALCDHPLSVHDDSGPLCTACLALGNKNARHRYVEAGHKMFNPYFEGETPVLYAYSRPSSPMGAVQRAYREQKRLRPMMILA